MRLIAGWPKATPRSYIWIIVLLHLVVGTAYSALIPAWEAPDEPAHADYVFFVARYQALPSLEGMSTSELTGKEFSQPPLYYFLSAIPVALFRTGTSHTLVKNPYIWSGGGVNYVVHDPAEEAFPWHGTILSLHLIRLVSVLISSLGVLITYMLGKALWDDEWLALLAAALYAFWPEFLFMGSVANNDVLIAVMGSYVLLLAIRALKGAPHSGDLWLLWGVTLISFFVKYLALAFVPFVAVVSVAAVTTNRDFWKPHWRSLTVLSGILLLTLTSWFAYNLKTTGVLVPRDPYALLLLMKKLQRPSQFAAMIALIPKATLHGLYSFWGVFGWCSVPAPQWTVWFGSSLAIIGAAGLLVSFVKGKATDRWAISILLFFLLNVLTLPLIREISYGKTDLCGRYMLSGLTAVSVLLAWGWRTMLPSAQFRRAAAIAATAGMSVLSLYILLGTIQPAYAGPKVYNGNISSPPQENEAHIRFGNSIELVSYRIQPQTVKPRNVVSVTAVWKCLKPIEKNYTLGLQILGRGMKVYGEKYLYPGNGEFPTSMWKPGDTFREVYRIPPTHPGPLPTLGRVQISFFLAKGKNKWTTLPVYDASGRPIGGALRLGRLKLAGTGPAGVSTSPEHKIAADFDDHISLIGYTLDGSPTAGYKLKLTLFWKANGRPSTPYNTFVHLLDANGTQVLGADAPPGGEYYPTDIWDVGDVVTSTHTLMLPTNLPSGRYRLEVGLYRLDTGERPKVVTANGFRLPHDAVPLTEMRITALPEKVMLPMVEH